ncbi:MAG: bifunctional methylenetetrahydrofolate dehydrogenase/methenyltetrahydrofolate cyclohydrolase FolD [Rhodospirillales bacterium]|nr:bifunctional methylenetetrahydrofolate dehydrogenase/methenyltetrahydrofolate cyclohydrolase FolD [Rhodospirillales bacterium]
MSEAKIIDGRKFAAEVRRGVAAEVAALKSAHALTPTLAIVLVGDDEASHIYVRAKGRQAEEAGMATLEHLLPRETPERDLLTLIQRLNADDTINGILIQLPLPAPIATPKVLAAVDPAKDVDGFHPINVGRLWSGAPGMVPCTPYGCMAMLKATLNGLAGLRALVIGRSNIVGKPMAALLLRENATVTIAHSKTRDLAERCREADVLVAAVGHARLVKGVWIKPGACVLDVGINRVSAPDKGKGKTRIVGDVDFEVARKVAGHITPVPGGVGPMTIACLMRNTVIAARRQRGLPDPAI